MTRTMEKVTEDTVRNRDYLVQELQARVKYLEGEMTGIVLELLKACGVNEFEARAKLWHAISMGQLDLDNKLHLHRVLGEK